MYICLHIKLIKNENINPIAKAKITPPEVPIVADLTSWRLSKSMLTFTTK
jgi:hypothetical protein